MALWHDVHLHLPTRLKSLRDLPQNLYSSFDEQKRRKAHALLER